MRHLIRTAVPLVAVTLVLAACGADGRDEDDGDGATAPQPGVTDDSVTVGAGELVS